MIFPRNFVRMVTLLAILMFLVPATTAGQGLESAEHVPEWHETEFLFRLGAEYGFPVEQASLGPAVFADWGGSRWTLVYGIGMVTGF